MRSLVGMILGVSNIQTQTNDSFEIQAVFSVAITALFVIASKQASIPQHHERATSPNICGAVVTW